MTPPLGKRSPSDRSSNAQALNEKATDIQTSDIGTNRRLLVVDDEAAIRIILKATLELTAKWTILVAASGQEGMSMAQTEQPDAILLDVMMPNIDGITLFHQLKEQPTTQHIPVVFLTAQAREVERKQLERLGVGVILKPFEPEKIAIQIQELLGWE
ncbi:hypothetical protein S7335_5573 [Synechococcus sp. PCC 7335]|uniref:response regulator n=1 Tax=Synechococcus sp. (strain ATCC 29403 / PCC 7335) TaxID=91464 RepID=UPI00017EB862|nr:response regulator [Synechococcus sp. PCC 7335]EDX87862.1 hypothetical protein S7335_5573 [Synechococcus sp. PCC 7335]